MSAGCFGFNCGEHMRTRLVMGRDYFFHSIGNNAPAFSGVISTPTNDNA